MAGLPGWVPLSLLAPRLSFWSECMNIRSHEIEKISTLFQSLPPRPRQVVVILREALKALSCHPSYLAIDAGSRSIH